MGSWLTPSQTECIFSKEEKSNECKFECRNRLEHQSIQRGGKMRGKEVQRMRGGLQMMERKGLDVDRERAQQGPHLQLYSWLHQMMGGVYSHWGSFNPATGDQPGWSVPKMRAPTGGCTLWGNFKVASIFCLIYYTCL